MLLCLTIDNFALVDHLKLDFDQGLNVLTGETGAGKSIILDAIEIALGGKSNSRFIRTGGDRAFVEATFEISPKFQEWLLEQEIPLQDNKLVCTRELSLGKQNRIKSRCSLNGVVVKIQLMEEFRAKLIEITSQGQTSDLLVADKQRELIDIFGGQKIIQQKTIVAKAYSNFQKAKSKLEQKRKAQQEQLQKQSLLEFQLKEFMEAELTTPDELENLEQERDRLSHIVELQQLSYQAYQLLYQNEVDASTSSDLLADAEKNLEDMTAYDSNLQPILEMIQSAIILVIEAGQQLNGYGDSLEADPERLEEVEVRIRTLKNLCRKYGGDLSEVIVIYLQVQQELTELTDSEQSLENLETAYQQTSKELDLVCEQLSQLRQKAITKLEKQLIKELKPLAMEKVLFECKLKSCQPSVHGADEVNFYFSPNPGEALQPLAETASGGEMSRFLLALKACFSSAKANSKSLVFDEIDAGVSGKVAQAIAEKLYQLSQSNQILCVTHQPLIAAMADAHYKVAKIIIDPNKQNTNRSQSEGKQTNSEVRTVVRVQNISDRNLRVKKLAQITGGHSAEQAIEFAQSLLDKAETYRQQQK